MADKHSDWVPEAVGHRLGSFCMKKKPKITPENKAILEAPENKDAGRKIGALSPWDKRQPKPTKKPKKR